MTNLIKRLKLARMLSMFGEITTVEGVTFNYEGDLDVNVQVFTPGEDGELVPVSDGNYEYDGKVYTVEGGVVTVIADKDKAESIAEPNTDPEPEENPAEPAEETAPEEAPAEEEEKPAEEGEEKPVEEEEKPAEEEEKPAEEETPATEEGEEKNEEVDTLKAENDALKAKIEELNAKIAELEAKIAEAEEPVEESANEKFKKQEPASTTGMKNEYNIIAELRKRNNQE